MALDRKNDDYYYKVGRVIGVIEHYAGNNWRANTLNRMFQNPAYGLKDWRRYIDTEDEYLQELSDVVLPSSPVAPVDEAKMWVGFLAQKYEYGNIETRTRIGKRIADIRKERGMTQEELAEKSGIQRTHITRIEQGKYSVGIDLLQRIADVFGMDVDFVEQPD